MGSASGALKFTTPAIVTGLRCQRRNTAVKICDWFMGCSLLTICLRNTNRQNIRFALKNQSDKNLVETRKREKLAVPCKTHMLELRCSSESKLTVENGRWVSQFRQLGHCHNNCWLENPHSLHWYLGIVAARLLSAVRTLFRAFSLFCPFAVCTN